jgi:predicted lactoylglutathione lyase
MKPIIFVNLPVMDLKASMEFYAAIGFVNNPRFTDETAACMVFSDEIMVMLLTHDHQRNREGLPIKAKAT